MRELLRVPTLLALLVSGWFCSFAGYAYVAWGPELVQEYKGFSAREAGLGVALAVVVGGTCGIAVGAYLSDRLAKRRSRGRAAVILVGFVLGVPGIFLALHTAGKLPFVVFFGLAAFFLSWYHGPLTATIHDLVPPRGHDTAFGFYNLFVNLSSMALAPLLIGKVADRYNLITALHIPIASQLFGAAFFVVVIQCIRRNGLRHPVLARHWAERPAGSCNRWLLWIRKAPVLEFCGSGQCFVPGRLCKIGHRFGKNDFKKEKTIWDS